MYLLNVELKLNWTIYSKVAHPTIDDLTIIQSSPSSIISIPLSICSSDYIPPTADTFGYITFPFTPTEVGLWKTSLYVSGTLVGTHNTVISRSDTYTKKINKNSVDTREFNESGIDLTCITLQCPITTSLPGTAVPGCAIPGT